MSTLRTAAQQALEALYQAREFTELYDTEHAAAVNERCHENITALRAALAQQAEPIKPVGRNWMLDGQPYGQAYYGNPPDTDIAERAAIAGRTVRLLYTHPQPQRKPLTEEEIERICMTYQSPRQAARAVERAHGITDPQIADRLARHGIPMPEGDNDGR